MIMKRIFVFLLFLVPALFSESRGFEGSWFGHVAEYNDSVFSVSTAIPNGFVEGTNAITMIQYAPNETWGAMVADKQSRYLYCATALSKDRECMLLYPYLVFVKSGAMKSADAPFTLCRNQYLAEQCTARIQDKVEKITGAEAQEWGYADTVYIVDFPVAQPCVKRYTHCMGVYMAKAGYTPIFLKLLFTDKGYEDRGTIMKKVKGCMRYTDGVVADNKKVIEASNKLLRMHRHKVVPLLHGEPVR